MGFFSTIGNVASGNAAVVSGASQGVDPLTAAAVSGNTQGVVKGVGKVGIVAGGVAVPGLIAGGISMK